VLQISHVEPEAKSAIRNGNHSTISDILPKPEADNVSTCPSPPLARMLHASKLQAYNLQRKSQFWNFRNYF
jgi:hypothetical protein